MLAMSDAQGRVDGSIPGLADLARVTIDQCQEALKCLSEPDFFSRTKEHEGRRIEIIDGGWQILNYMKYRESDSTDLRREQNREAQKRWRNKHKLIISNVSPGKPRSAQAEAEAEASEPERQPAAPRARDPLFDALALSTEGPLEQIPKKKNRAIGVALAEIRSVAPDLTPAEIERRAANYRLHMPGVTLTANALASHWARCDQKPNGNHALDKRPNSRRYETVADYSGVKTHGLGS